MLFTLLLLGGGVWYAARNGWLSRLENAINTKTDEAIKPKS